MSQPPLYIFAPRQSPRLLYVAQWLSEALGTAVHVVTEATAAGAKVLAYGTLVTGGVSCPDSGLLWETNIRPLIPETGSWEELLTFFPGEGDVPFDLFAAIFYLLSRYEEYQEFTPDQHGRYPATESILFKNNVLRRPLADLWLEKLRQLLHLPPTNYQRRLTYDIDRAYHIRHWPAARGWGLWAKALLQGSPGKAKEICHVAAGKRRDPLDAFGFIMQQQPKLPIIFFVLAARKSSEYDVNLSPAKKGMQELIKQLARNGTIGVHPSYRSSEQPELISEEKNLLEKASGQTITYSRQHFMRLRLPHTYSDLMGAGITDDFSMGYGSHTGFRAGTGRSFLWYDLSSEKQQPLRIHPFPFMDTTAHFYEKLSPEQAFSVLQKMERDLKECGSQLITVFHNYSLGTDPVWKGWRAAYEQWLFEANNK